jgi:hypothetical protein
MKKITVGQYKKAMKAYSENPTDENAIRAVFARCYFYQQDTTNHQALTHLQRWKKHCNEIASVASAYSWDGKDLVDFIRTMFEEREELLMRIKHPRIFKGRALKIGSDEKE